MWKKIWEGWKRVAHAIGNFQARVLLTLIYALLVLPMGLAVRIFSDPLRIRRRPEKWLDRPPDDTSALEWARRYW